MDCEVDLGKKESQFCFVFFVKWDQMIRGGIAGMVKELEHHFPHDLLWVFMDSLEMKMRVK